MELGAPRAQERFLGAVFDSSYSLALRLYRDEEQAKDTAQDVSFKVFEKYLSRGRLSSSMNMGALVYTMTKNAFVSEYRRSKKHSFRSLDEVSLAEMSSPLVGAADEDLIAQEFYDEHCRDAPHAQLWQMHEDGFKYKEIAEVLGYKMGTVKARIFEARKAMMESYKEQERRDQRRVA